MDVTKLPIPEHDFWFVLLYLHYSKSRSKFTLIQSMLDNSHGNNRSLIHNYIHVMRTAKYIKSKDGIYSITMKGMWALFSNNQDL
jgi:hypothetical protein